MRVPNLLPGFKEEIEPLLVLPGFKEEIRPLLVLPGFKEGIELLLVLPGVKEGIELLLVLDPGFKQGTYSSDRSEFSAGITLMSVSALSKGENFTQIYIKKQQR